MPHWILDCLGCKRKFNYSETVKPQSSIELLEKPVFAEAGETVECPHCEESHSYQPYMLRFSSD